MSDDLISRSALLGVIDAAFFATDPTGEEQLGFLKCRRFVREAPAIDAVEVVRCRDCKYVLEKHYEEPGEPPYIKYLCACPYGLSNRYGIDENDFCSRGEKMHLEEEE